MSARRKAKPASVSAIAKLGIDARFIPCGVSLRAAIMAHREALAAVREIDVRAAQGGTTADAEVDRVCRIERNAIRAVSLARTRTLAEAATVVSYLFAYWHEHGDNSGAEAEAAWPTLQCAVASLNGHLPVRRDTTFKPRTERREAA